MVLLEEFKDKVPPDIRSHLDEQKVEDLEKPAIMADDYALTHKMSSTCKSGNPQQKRYHGSGNRENISRNMDDRKRQVKSTENVGLVSKVEPLKPISCGHCGKPGHIIINCWKLGGKTPCEHCGKFNHKSEDCRIANNKLQKEVKPTGLTSLKGLKVSPFNESENSKGVKVKPLYNVKSCIEEEISPNTESDYMENYKPFISEGVVSLVGDENRSQKVKILPRIADCIDQIGNAKFVSTFDMLKGYWQVPLTQRAREISAFVTPSGLYQYKVMPFGMKNAPATFQRMVIKLVRDIDGCEGYIDDE